MEMSLMLLLRWAHSWMKKNCIILRSLYTGTCLFLSLQVYIVCRIYSYRATTKYNIVVVVVVIIFDEKRTWGKTQLWRPNFLDGIPLEKKNKK